jgi:multiple sugar transport system permease protein
VAGTLLLKGNGSMINKKKSVTVHIRRLAKPYLLLLPSIILIGIFKIYPIMYSVVGSMFKIGKGGVSRFVFLQNYISLFNEATFLNAFAVTLKFCILATMIQILLAVALAMFLNRNTKAVRISRTLLYIPVTINMVIACTVWNMFFSTSTGLLNTFLDAMGLPEQPFLTSPKQALGVLIFICCWKGTSYWMMFLLAGLQNINASVYEAGKIDGTNPGTEFFKITLPMLKNSMMFVIVSDTLINIFMFSPVYLLTKGGPSMSTDTLMYEAYSSAFSFGNYPRAYALVTIMLMLAIAIAGLQFFLMEDRDDEKRAKRRRLRYAKKAS